MRMSISAKSGISGSWAAFSKPVSPSAKAAAHDDEADDLPSDTASEGGQPTRADRARGAGKQAQVVVLEFSDGFGQTSRLELSGFASNPTLPASTFVLNPPPGYQVLRP